MAFIIAFCTLSSSNASAATFSDVKKYEKEIGYLADNNIIGGYPDGTFRPATELTRLQGIRVLLKVKGVTDLTAPNPKFTDMAPGSHGYAEVAKAVQLGIISGKTGKNGSKYFDPSGKLTRGQMAKIIVETKKYPIDKSHSFRDLPKTSGYYDYVSTLAAQRVTEGYEDLTFKPNNTVTRQHFAVFVARMLDDKFKPAPRSTSYLMDTTKDYHWEYKDGGKTYTSVARYVGPQYSSNIALDRWNETGGIDGGPFGVAEDKERLYLAIGNHYYTELEYPLYEGKTFDDGWEEDLKYKVVSMNRVVTTKAGTFRNVIELKSPYGSTDYFAPNIGRIKVVENGKTVFELVKLSSRR